MNKIIQSLWKILGRRSHGFERVGPLHVPGAPVAADPRLLEKLPLFLFAAFLENKAEKASSSYFLGEDEMLIFVFHNIFKFIIYSLNYYFI